MRAKGEERCRACDEDAKHLHHLIPKSLCPEFAMDVEGNGLPLCMLCHMRYHARALELPRALLTDGEVEAIILRMGERWVDRHYPVDP